MPTVPELVSTGIGGGATPIDPDAAYALNRVELNSFQHKGACYTSYLDRGYADGKKIKVLKKMGANSNSITAIWQMETGTSNDITIQKNSRAATVQVIQDTKVAGMKAVLKPHIDCADGTFRGDIAPTNWDTWFANYTSWIVSYALIAETYGVDLFVIGTELKSATVYTSKWQAVIAAIRAVYSGPLTYAALCANPSEEYTKIAFWKDLDIIGLDFYYVCTDHADPTVEELVDSFYGNNRNQQPLQLIMEFQKSLDMPVLFTECGCPHLQGGNINMNSTGLTVLDDVEQANYAEALYRVFSNVGDWFLGFHMWRFDADGVNAGGLSESYCIEHHTVQDVLTTWFKTDTGTIRDNNLYITGTTKLKDRTTSAGFEILTTEQAPLDGTGNPFTQYQLTRGSETIRTDTTTANYWAKVSSIVITARFQYAAGILTILGGGTTADLNFHPHAIIFFSAKNDNVLGSGSPHVEVSMALNESINRSNVFAVVTQNDTTKTVVDLYVQVSNEFQSYNVSLQHRQIGTDLVSGQILMFSQQPLQSALPAGTQIACTYGKSIVRASKAASNQSITAGTPAVIVFDGVNENVMNDYANNTSTFTPETAGNFFMRVAFKTVSQLNPTHFDLEIHVNGSLRERLESRDVASVNATIIHGSTMVSLNSGDTVQIKVNADKSFDILASQAETVWRIRQF